MATSVASFNSKFYLVISSLLLVTSHFCVTEAQSSVPIVEGLSWSFYDSSCPKLESIVRKQLQKVFKNDIGHAPGLLRLHFHDCFVQGCEGSVLLDGSSSGPSEKDAPPNLSLRPEAFKIINDLRRRVHKQCGRVVSCSDITALAARDAVFLNLTLGHGVCNVLSGEMVRVYMNPSSVYINWSGGPYYDVALGRRDTLNFASRNVTLANLPAPTSNTSALLTSLATKNLDATDVVALSGGHTIGIGHCSSFTGRLYPTQDANMDKTFATNLKVVCPTATTNATTVLDIRSPNVFDNKYYVDLMNRQGLFTSDQDLYTDRRTRGIVTSFAVNQTLFFEKFVDAMMKMGQLNVLTGNQGEIRANCSVRNSNGAFLASDVDEPEEKWSKDTVGGSVFTTFLIVFLYVVRDVMVRCYLMDRIVGRARRMHLQILRAQAFKIIDDLRKRVHEECGRVVSCADIVVLAARDAVFLVSSKANMSSLARCINCLFVIVGRWPDYDVPLGRKDGLNFAARDATLANLPSPTSNASAILSSLATQNLDATDVVDLSGGYTIGIGHCSSFTLASFRPKILQWTKPLPMTSSTFDSKITSTMLT
ncbi:hypothetical protein RJ639_004738 [Escallonia herrerae]|uniref:peroxidase n=1 Tax=Escallonia herrerae TaxID=1293975 RepID=A0AA88W1K6_9ASTE|nr:hypothetical protein RJ639_004738 [Escallonia herrerae]